MKEFKKIGDIVVRIVENTNIHRINRLMKKK